MKLNLSHGLPRIAQSNNWILRTIWCIFFIVSTIYCSYTIIQSFISYFNYEVTATISRIQDLPAAFPAITICNINPFHELFATKYILKKIIIGKCFQLQNGNSFLACVNSSDQNDVFDTFADQMKRIIANDNLTDRQRYKLGYWLDEDLLVSCSYNGESCNETNFERYWDNQYGNCYMFNKGNAIKTIVKSSTTGEKHGLKMELIVSK